MRWTAPGLLAIVFLAASASSEPLSERIVSYRIDARLNVDSRVIHGSQRLTWRNPSSDDVQELQFHLYLNAFQNDRSTFMQEYKRGLGSPIGVRPGDLTGEGSGFIRVEKITTEFGEDLTGAMRFIMPDDENIDDQTVVSLELPESLGPGETLALDMHFRSRLPEPPVKRSGMRGEYVFAGQWFPKIGVYQNGEWNCHQYHANSEFFADFGVYDVKLTVPAEMTVGATGLEVKVTDNPDGTRTHEYHAEDVHDFAWTASPVFVEFTTRAQDVDIRLLLQPEHVGQSERHLMAARAVVEKMQDWYGDYPYPNLTVVDPRHGATYTGGMEYPTLITAWTAYGLPDGVRIPEMIIIHEFIHNYFYQLVATNEFEESWLDEGITSYVELQVMREVFGPAANLIDFLGFEIADLQYKRWMCHRYNNPDAMLRPVWDYHSAASYRVNSYLRPALLLETLKNHLGAEVMRRILRSYVERWRFKHPQTDDFLAVVNQVAGQDMGWLFDQALYSNARLDYAVDYVHTREGNQPGVFESEVGVSRIGEFQFPMELELIFEDGQKIRETFDGTTVWRKYRYQKPARLVSAELDPDRKVPLEASRGNNSRTVEPHGAGAFKTGAAALFWSQVLMDLP